MILSAGDTLLRLLLFWAMFLPLGARYSVDAALDKNPSVPRSLCNLACAAILLQMTFMYFFSFILKDGSTWNDGTALYYALSVDQLTRPLGGGKAGDMHESGGHALQVADLKQPKCDLVCRFVSE